MPLTKEQALRIALTQSLKKNDVYRKALEEIKIQTMARNMYDIAEKALKEK